MTHQDIYSKVSEICLLHILNDEWKQFQKEYPRSTYIDFIKWDGKNFGMFSWNVFFVKKSLYWLGFLPFSFFFTMTSFVLFFSYYYHSITQVRQLRVTGSCNTNIIYLLVKYTKIRAFINWCLWNLVMIVKWNHFGMM